MRENESPADGSGADAAGGADPAGVVVAVVRSGGIAGMRRRWRAEPDSEHAPEWLELVRCCPWDEPMDDPSGADRYMWSIHARLRDEQLEQVVPDARLQGAWRRLVDAVRDADADTDVAP